MTDSESDYDPPVTRRLLRKRPRWSFAESDSDDGTQSAGGSGISFHDTREDMTSDDEDHSQEAFTTQSEVEDVQEETDNDGTDQSSERDDELEGEETDSVQDPLIPLGEPANLQVNTNNRCYLVTYSQVDVTLVPTREAFADLCVDAFGGVGNVDHYACAKEPHVNGGTHYHVSIKLSAGQRWFHAKNYLLNRGISVNFARPPIGKCLYAWIYRYISKYDQEVFHSDPHPSLEQIEDSRKMEKALAALSAKLAGETEDGVRAKSGKTIRLKDAEVARYCRKKNISTITEMMADAEVRVGEGDDTLSNYIFSRTMKQLSELLLKNEMMATAIDKVQHLQMSRLERLSLFKEKECARNCNGVWYTCALDILKRNKINKYVFADAIRELLEKGRGKGRNLFLLGPHTSGKTFLFKPLLAMYPHHFSNPPASTFGWLGADEASLILLNDYRWESKKNGGNIDWGTLLNLLEGFPTTLPAPMNSFCKHVHITTDVPIFGTGPDPIRWYTTHPEEPRNKKHAKEDGQMDSRWRTFELTYTFTEQERIKDVPCCPSCFCRFSFLGYGDDS